MLFAIARALISLIFLASGIAKLFNWQGAEEGLSAALCQWHIYLEGVPIIDDILGFLVPLVPLLLIGAICLELGGGFFILFRKSSRFGAILLLIFLIPVTIIYHAFWFEIGEQVHFQAIKFLSNLAIMGGLLLLATRQTFKRDQKFHEGKRPR